MADLCRREKENIRYGCDMIEVLKSQEMIEEARAGLDKLGCDTTHGFARTMFQMRYLLRFRQIPPRVAVNKSWDVLKIVETIEKHKPDKDISIFDMGSFNCEAPVSLWMRGYRNIRASDLNPKGRCINWYGNGINFQCENFYEPGIDDESLDVMTSLSVIEHGWDQKKFIEICMRYLKPGGIVCFSTDFHPEKQPIPEDFRLFNLSYMIFSRAEIESLVRAAEESGLELLGPANWGESEYPINFLEKDFTFIYLAFRKK